MNRLKSILLLQLSALFVLSAGDSLAQSRTLNVLVQTELKPLTAVGLIVQPGRTVQKPEVSKEEVRPGLWKISFKAQGSELAADSLASAMIIAEDGSIALGDMTPAAGRSVVDRFLSLPECSSPKISITRLQSQASVLESLVAVRGERRNVLQQGLRKELRGELLEKALRLEKGFGLTREIELNPELPPLELIDRLSRLNAAIKNHRASRESPAPVDSAVPSLKAP